MSGYTKAELPAEYHDLWDLCCIFKASVNEQEEVIRVEAISNPTALELSSEVKKTVLSSSFIDEALKRKDELEKLSIFFQRKIDKSAAEAADKAAMKTAEDMLLSALQNFVPNEAIEAMRKSAGISETRLAALKERAQASLPFQA